MAVNEQFSYRRAELARQYCDALEGKTILDAASGLFLSAPRRTGKSTFMREDLTPAMAARGWKSSISTCGPTGSKTPQN